MLLTKNFINSIVIILLTGFMSACSADTNASEALQKSTAVETQKLSKQLELAVYKSPTCGCCNKWISHLHENEIDSTAHHPSDLSEIKNQFGIQSNYQSCHTAVSQDGFVFEGHIPANLIKRFLANTPEGAIGLSVPGMPLGSPGMEMGDKFNEYSVLLLLKDGSSSVYAEIKNASQQY